MDFATVKYNYDHKLWNIVLVRTAVRKGVITKDEFKVITGKDY